MKEYILDTFKIGMSEKEAEKYFSKEIKKMNITERKIYLKNERKYFKFFKILLKRNRKFIIKIREYFEYEISNLFKKEQKILKKEIININKFNFKFKNMHLKNRKYLEIFLKISYRDAFGYQGMYTIYFPKDKIYINAITDYQFIIIFINNNKEEIIKIAKKCKLFIGLLQIRSNDEEGLESLGRPANEYVKKKFGEDNNSKIKLTTDGIVLSNADVGEKVGDNSLALGVGTIVETGVATGTGIIAGGVSAPVVAGITVVGGIVYYAIMPEERKEELKREISEIYEDVKKSFRSILDKESSKNLVADVIKFKLKEKGIEVDVKIDKDGNVMYTLSPLPEDMKKQRIPPLPLPEEEKNPRIPPMEPLKEETEKEKREREEKARREEQEFFNELQKPNGIPIPKEQPVKIYTISKNEANEMYKGVEGKNKVTNIPKNLTKKEVENNKNKANSKILDKQLQNAGIKKPDYNSAAHHLVSDATMPKATKTLNKYGIEINSATNGVYLPTSKADTSKVTTEVVHSGPNGKEYKELLEKSIPYIAENMENTNASYDEIQAALENELNNTRIKLLTGELKINNAKFKTTEKGKKQNENI